MRIHDFTAIPCVSCCYTVPSPLILIVRHCTFAHSNCINFAIILCNVQDFIFQQTPVFLSRLQYRRDAEKLYHSQMIDAMKGKSAYPSIRTFHPSLVSTNSVFHDLAMAEEW